MKAAKIMTKQKSGLIVNVSSVGGKLYLFTPAYGVGKAGVRPWITFINIFSFSFQLCLVETW